MGKSYITLADIEKIDKEFLTAADVAPVLGIDAQCIRSQAQSDPSKLGFPVIVIGTRVHIPRDGFVIFCKYGANAQLSIESKEKSADTSSPFERSSISTDYIRVETVPIEILAKMLSTNPSEIKSGIKNHTMPVGCILQADDSTRERTIIIKTRLERWLAGEL